MTNEELYELMDRFGCSSLTGLKVTDGAFSVELSRSLTAPAVPAAPSEGEQSAPVPRQEKAAVITAPLVGTFYAASAPGEIPYVRPGDRVAKGQTVCMLEAMKMMSEIPAPCDCVIEEALKADGELAAYGDALFRYRAV